MNRCGIFPKQQILNSEMSQDLKNDIILSRITYQLVPLDDHRKNRAEKAIQTWRDHLVVVLSGTATTFPLHLWCQIIPQSERQLLLLCQRKCNPKVNAYTHLYAQHDYNTQLFVPISME